VYLVELGHPMRVLNARIGTEVRPSPCHLGRRGQSGKLVDAVLLVILGSRIEHVEPDVDEFVSELWKVIWVLVLILNVVRRLDLGTVFEVREGQGRLRGHPQSDQRAHADLATPFHSSSSFCTVYGAEKSG
jgi:hypothetical protein